MKNAIRSIKYLLSLCLLYGAAIFVMHSTDSMSMPLSDTFSALLHSTRGALLIAAVLVLAAGYPYFGFLKRRLKGDTQRHRQQIINAFITRGFRLTEERDGEMIFRADNIIKRTTLLFEDDIHVTQEGEEIEIKGVRREVAYVVYKLEGYISASER